MNKGQLYRILKSLQKKGLVEATLEYPTRFTAVPFEKVIDSFIKSKREEVAFIEEAKQDLLLDWKNIRRIELESPLEKFSVIEGNKKIYNKITQMMKETDSQFAMALTVSDLLLAEKFGVFDYFLTHPKKDDVNFRVLTQFSKQDLKAIKSLRTKLKQVISFRGRNPNLGLPSFSRMVIRDREEIILFISGTSQALTKEKVVSLCTNCKAMIQSFSSVFEDLWLNSLTIGRIIDEIKTGKPLPKMMLIRNRKTARKLYFDALNAANKKIFIVTSSRRLVGIANNIKLLSEWTKNGASIKIMAPIVSENLEAANKLLKFCEVRHVKLGYTEMTIIDDESLFQFNKPSPEHDKNNEILNLENVLFTNDPTFVKKTKKMLNDIWENAHAPSTVSLSSITRIEPSDSASPSDKKMIAEIKKIHGLESNDETLPRGFTEKALMNKFITAKRMPVKDLSKEPVTFYCSAGQAVIHLPPNLKLPHMLFHILHLNKKSAFGAEDAMIILCRQDGPTGYSYIPAAFISDNPEGIAFWKKTFAGIPFEQKLAKKNEFHVQIQHNILFAGWTVPIPLVPQQLILPPSCILIEGYGGVKTGKYTIMEPSGDIIINQVNYFEAFVTFMHPASRYSGPGTDGYLFREFLSTTYPPSTT